VLTLNIVMMKHVTASFINRESNLALCHIHRQNHGSYRHGGKSIGKLLPRITGFIIPSYRQLHRVAIVCSAWLGAKKSTGTTSLLLDAIRLANSNKAQSEDLQNIVEMIKEEYLIAADEGIGKNVTKILEDVQLQSTTTAKSYAAC
jgi:hypothetical protein